MNEKLKNKSVPVKNKGKNGGARPGAGRKPGGMNKKTLEQKIVMEELRQRIMTNADGLLNAQLSVAKGAQYLYRIEKTTNKNGKEVQEHILVTDPEEIKEALDSLEEGNSSDKYYYITAEKPDSKAIDSLLDRTFGKAKESVELEAGNSLIGLFRNVRTKLGKRDRGESDTVEETS